MGVLLDVDSYAVAVCIARHLIRHVFQQLVELQILIEIKLEDLNFQRQRLRRERTTCRPAPSSCVASGILE